MKKHGNVTGELHIKGHLADCLACKKCIYSEGPKPFADKYYKAYCLMFPREEGKMKPNAVLYDGKPCQYYEEI